MCVYTFNFFFYISSLEEVNITKSVLYNMASLLF